MTSDAERLRALWAGSFGDQYTERNRAAGAARAPFWSQLLGAYPVESLLEVGCNLGGNLRCVLEAAPEVVATGVDINAEALRRCRAIPGARVARASADALPFADGCFELCFTTGVLIHQAPESLPAVMREVTRCSRRYVLCGEYFSEEPTEVPYRGQRGALYKCDFGRLYVETCPELRLIEGGFLSQDEGWDDVTWWLFERAGF